MKNRIGIIIGVLVLVCVGLGIALIAIKKQASDEVGVYTVKNTALSNDLATATDQLQERKKVIDDLYAQREQSAQALNTLTNKYVESLSTISQVSNKLAKTEIALKDSQEETAKRDLKITQLETENQTLDKRAVDLNSSITNLTTQIAETERKLATSEGEKGFLQKELKRLMAEKAELERQFNDITVLRAQVSKLKSEMAVARRVEWIRQGLTASPDQRGAEKLLPGTAMSTAKPNKPSYDLNVEVNADGTIRVIPSLTNRPAATTPPSK